MKLALLTMTFERSLVERSEKRGGGCALALGGLTAHPQARRVSSLVLVHETPEVSEHIPRCLVTKGYRVLLKRVPHAERCFVSLLCRLFSNRGSPFSASFSATTCTIWTRPPIRG